MCVSRPTITDFLFSLFSAHIKFKNQWAKQKYVNFQCYCTCFLYFSSFLFSLYARWHFFCYICAPWPKWTPFNVTAVYSDWNMKLNVKVGKESFLRETRKKQSFVERGQQTDILCSLCDNFIIFVIYIYIQCLNSMFLGLGEKYFLFQ